MCDNRPLPAPPQICRPNRWESHGCDGHPGESEVAKPVQSVSEGEDSAPQRPCGPERPVQPGSSHDAAAARKRREKLKHYNCVSPERCLPLLLPLRPSRRLPKPWHVQLIASLSVSPNHRLAPWVRASRRSSKVRGRRNPRSQGSVWGLRRRSAPPSALPPGEDSGPGRTPAPLPPDCVLFLNQFKRACSRPPKRRVEAMPVLTVHGHAKRRRDRLAESSVEPQLTYSSTHQCPNTHKCPSPSVINVTLGAHTGQEPRAQAQYVCMQWAP